MYDRRIGIARSNTRRSGGRGRDRHASQEQPVVYHYCSIYSLPAKLRAGQIDVFYGDKVIDSTGEWYEVPDRAAVAWCTTESLFDTACMASCLLGRDGSAALLTPGAGTDLARIVVDARAAPYRWDRHWRRMGVPQRLVEAFAVSAQVRCESDWHNWRVSAAPISASAWRSVEVWDTWRLEWIPIQQTRDRMVGELILMLPPHLRIGLDQPAVPRLPPDVAQACWSLTSVDRERRDDDAAEVGDDCYTDFWEIHTFEDLCRKRASVREQWLRADALAALGLAVFPCDTYGGCDACLRSTTASSASEFVDRMWLKGYPDCGIGIVFGSESSGIIGVLRQGIDRQQALAPSCTWPETLCLRPFPTGPEADILLYRVPRTVNVPTDCLKATEHVRIVLLGERRWQLLDTQPVGNNPGLRLPPDAEIATASPWLMQMLERLPLAHHEDDSGSAYQHCEYFDMDLPTARRRCVRYRTRCTVAGNVTEPYSRGASSPSVCFQQEGHDDARPADYEQCDIDR